MNLTKLNKWILFVLVVFIFLINCNMSFAGVPATKVHKPDGDTLRLESGGEIEAKSGGLVDLQSGSTVYADGSITTTGDDVDITTHVRVDGDITATGAVNSEDSLADDASIHESMVLGETTAKSTFTPTAVTLDDGVTFTNNGTSALVGQTTVTGATIMNGDITAGNTSADTMTVNANATFSGSVALQSHTFIPLFDISVTSPTGAGDFCRTSEGLVYVSTGPEVALYNWVKVGGQ